MHKNDLIIATYTLITAEITAVLWVHVLVAG